MTLLMRDQLNTKEGREQEHYRAEHLQVFCLV